MRRTRYAAFAKELPQGWRPQVGETVYVFGPAAYGTVIADLGMDVFKVRRGGRVLGRPKHDKQMRLDQLRPITEV